MSKAMVYGKEDAVTLATTQTEITGVDNAAWLTIDETDVDVYIVTHSVSDGAALPSSGRILVPSASVPYTRCLKQYGRVALAGSGSGTCRCTFDVDLD